MSQSDVHHTVHDPLVAPPAKAPAIAIGATVRIINPVVFGQSRAAAGARGLNSSYPADLTGDWLVRNVAVATARDGQPLHLYALTRSLDDNPRSAFLVPGHQLLQQ